ncbi:MAG: molybdate ABC transporter substrate-binding protein [Nitrospirae bacterium]|nr:molybdate ABC transporter substrate-binding protein [Nitrospirota bacterium]
MLSVLVKLILTVVFYSTAGAGQELTISAAISLKDAFGEVGKVFEEKNKGSKVLFNFGASGILIRQIEGGAPVDLFASASAKEMDELEKKGLILSETRSNFAGNSMVVIVPAASKIDISSFEGLKSPEIKKIAIGNPSTVPAGRYASKVFQYYKIQTDLKDKFVFTENVRQTLDYVVRAEVDAGVVYTTDAMTRGKEVRVIKTAPLDSHSSIVYPICVVRDTRNKDIAKAFISLLMSDVGKRILEKYGFKISWNSSVYD